MKKILFSLKVLILFSLFILLSSSSIQAQSTVNVSSGNIWNEYISNPLFGGPTDGTNRGYYPCVIKVGTSYHIWYGDGSNTRHATSSSPDFSGATFPAPLVTGIILPAYHPHVLYNADGWDVGGTHYTNPFLLYSPTSDWTHVYIYNSADGNSWTSI
ncbi:MAG: hypothetical protein L0Y76_06145, partial [Ignavibacteria bacterium]|nr:hypothetical protein [Ignavibacteria bacterium]